MALVLLLCAVGGRAQTPREQVVRFTVFAARPIAGLEFVPQAKAAPQKILFFPTTRSPRYVFRGAMPLRFRDASSGAVVAEATIPPEIHDAFLLFSPFASPTSAGLRYQIAVLDDAATRHGPGGLAIVNLSGLALAGTVDAENVALKAGLNPTFAIGRQATVMLRTPVRNRTYPAYTDTLELKPGERALLLLFPPFYRGSVQVQSRLLIDEPPR